MHGKYRESRAGFTLVEIMVVLAIVALISAIAIPGLAKLGAFSRDEFKRTVTQLDSLLRAAQIYSTTYNVDTAVVYTMDNYSATEAATGVLEAVPNPIVDSVTGNFVRQIEAAAMLYKIPEGKGPLGGQFVSAPGELGEFSYFPNGMSVLLYNPEEPFQNFYFEMGASNYIQAATDNCICSMGMNQIDVYLEGTGTVPFMAHVFKPSSRMSVVNACAGCDGERFAVYIAPSADRPLDERLTYPDQPTLGNASDGQPNLMFKKIYVHKSTARVRVPDSQ